ncbi:hypothetical protein ACGF1Z_08490 [Streptomyces sp. NPDC048018]|uniref:hypothetical protein n=1 Tax=Streptomyces sp. NPDC048018 TaxID=3365499 RepID=UPI0037153DA4
MGLRKKAAAVAVSTALLVGGGIAAASSAAAGYMCDPGYHCVYWGDLGDSASHSYYNSDNNFTDDYFNENAGTAGYGSVVNDKVWSASNSSTGGYESHYYRDIGYQGGLLFCVNPGSEAFGAELADWQRNQASSLKLLPSTTVRCF